MLPCNEDRDPLEVLAEEFMERQRRGESPSVSEYVARCPELAADIEELFPTIAVMERLKVHKEQESGARVSLGAVRLERLGDFRILGEIGRGGMGIVYEAFQESLDRHVAVKVLPRQLLLDPKQLLRFQREAQTAARLHHTNIVPVFGAGEHEGFHYIVMQLIRGVGLDAVLSRLQRAAASGGAEPAGQGSRLCAQGAGASEAASPVGAEGQSGQAETPRGSPATEEFDLQVDTQVNGNRQSDREAAFARACGPQGPSGRDYWRSVATTGLQVAEALHYAHGHHTLHRDIKPANLLLDSQGVVWITDFGLAKAMEQDNLSQTGAMAGTLRYMAPEQFSGQVDPRSDIYSLGLTLYEMLVLRPAFEDTSRSSLIRKIMHDEPPPPRKLNARIPRDLETIVLKAIAREPRDRYQTAGELARDLECYLEDRPIHARRTSAIERLWRWARRNRAVASLAASTLLLLVLVAVVASAGYVRTARANADEKLQRKKAEETTALALEALDSIFQQFAPDRTAPAAPTLVVGDAGEEINVPVQPVLSKEAAALLEHMLAFYDRLADQAGDDAKLRRKLAEANRRIGDIRQRLGNYDESKAAYLRAIEWYTRLADASAEDTELRMEIARIHNELGNLYCATNQADAGSESYFSALAVLKAISAESSDSPGQRYELARTYHFLSKRPGAEPGPPPSGPLGSGGPRRPGGHHMGFVFDPRGPRRPARGTPSDSSEESLDKAVALWQRLVADDSAWPPGRPSGPPPKPSHETPDERGPGDPPGPPPSNMGHKVREDNRQKAIDLLERLVAEHPGVPDYRHLLARCYREMPPQHFGPGEQPAEDPANRAAEILEKLRDEHPDVPEYRYDLSETYAMLDGRGSWGPEGPDRTEKQLSHEKLKKALAISEELVAEHPNIPDYVVSQVHIRLRLTDALRNSDPSGAEEILRKACDQQSALVRRFPGNSFYKFWLGVIQESRAGFLKDRRQWAEARALLESAISSLKEALQTDPKAAHVRGVLGGNYSNLAGVLRRMGEEQAAADADRQAQELRKGR